jgi:hypothetical protein
MEEISLVFGKQHPRAHARINERLCAKLVTHHDAAMALTIECDDNEPAAQQLVCRVTERGERTRKRSRQVSVESTSVACGELSSILWLTEKPATQAVLHGLRGSEHRELTNSMDCSASALGFPRKQLTGLPAPGPRQHPATQSSSSCSWMIAAS